MKETFNNKIGDWLENIKLHLDEAEMQEKLFDLQLSIDDSGMSNEDKLLSKMITGSLLKLSFILKNNSEKANKFIKHLIDC